MSVGEDVCVDVGMITREPSGNRDARGLLDDIPAEGKVSQPSLADRFSSLKVSQQDVDQAAGAGYVEVRLKWVRLSSSDTENKKRYCGVK